MIYKFADRSSKIEPSVIREILKMSSDPNMISFSAGSPAPQAFPVEKITEITAKVMQESPILALQYNVTEGYAPLRAQLKEMMKTRYNQGKDFDDLIITTGAQQAIDLTAKILLNKGDNVICENPSFLGSLNSFKAFESNLIGIDIESDGINTLELENALKTTENVKFIYVIPNYQNPTGVTMSLEKRKKVYQLAQKYDTLILEDNPYGDLNFTGETIPTIKSLDTDCRVIYCGSFSKTLSPGLRLGFAFASNEITNRMTIAKQSNDVHTPMLNQLICHEFLNQIDFDEHIKNLCEIYSKKANLMLSQVQESLDKRIKYTVPTGGLFMWCTLPDGCDGLAFQKEAIKRGVATVPGVAFSTDNKKGLTSFRMNFSTPTDENIIKGIKILSEIKF